MTEYRVIVAGSRGWADRAAVWSVLDGILAVHEPVTVVHGANPRGADNHAQAWAIERRAQGRFVTPEPHPAEWQAPCRAPCRPGHRRKRPAGGDFCPTAGDYRNQWMADFGADECVTFAVQCELARCPKRGTHPTHGTEDMAARARAAGIPVREYSQVLNIPVRPD